MSCPHNNPVGYVLPPFLDEAAKLQSAGARAGPGSGRVRTGPPAASECPAARGGTGDARSHGRSRQRRF